MITLNQRTSELGQRDGNLAASVYRASFTRVLSSSLYSIALSNILIFILNASPALLGLASALNAFSAFLGPLLLHGFSSRAGIKRTLIFISFIDLAIMSIVLTISNLWIIVIIYIIDGLATCMYWVNMSAAIRRWQDITHQTQHGKIYRRYGISWTLGGLSGELFGFLIICLGFDDYIVLFISAIMMIINLFFTFRIEIPKTIVKQNKKVTTRIPNPHQNGEGNAHKQILRGINRNPHKILNMLLAPAVLMIIGEIAVQMINGSYDFLYPFILRDADGSTGMVYLMSILQRISFLCAMYMSSHARSQGQLTGAMIGFGLATILTVQVIGIPGQVMFTIALMISSLAAGFIYGFSSQTLLKQGKGRAALKLASIYETASGAGFGLMLIISGLVGETNVSIVFIGLAAFLALCFVLFSISCMRQAKISFQLLIAYNASISMLQQSDDLTLWPIVLAYGFSAIIATRPQDTAKK